MSIAEINRKLDLHTRLLARLLSHEGMHSMALSADVQRLVDQVAANRNFAQSADQALGIMEQQIKNLTDQLGSVQAGVALNADDVAAIKKAAQDLSDTNTALQAAVPANVNSGGVDADGKPVQSGTQPQPDTPPAPVTASNAPTSGVGGPPAQPTVEPGTSGPAPD